MGRNRKRSKRMMDSIKTIDIDTSDDKAFTKPFVPMLANKQEMRESTKSLFTSPATLARPWYKPIGIHWSKSNLELYELGIKKDLFKERRFRANNRSFLKSRSNDCHHASAGAQAASGKARAGSAGDASVAKRPRLAENFVDVSDIIDDWADSGDDDEEVKIVGKKTNKRKIDFVDVRSIIDDWADSDDGEEEVRIVVNKNDKRKNVEVVDLEDKENDSSVTLIDLI